MNIGLFLVAFTLLGIAYLIVGVLASKKIKDNEDYFLAGRNLGIGFLTLTLVATHLGSGAILGTAQEAYSLGYVGILYNLGFALGFIVLGCGFAARLRSFNVSTTAELFEVKYNSPFLRKIASGLSALSLCGILVGVVIGARGALLGIGVQSELVFILFWVLVVAYTIVGGLKAVVATDALQVLVIIFVFTGIFVYSLFSDPTSMSALTALNASIPKATHLFSFNRLFSVFMLPILLSLIEQDFAQRFFAAKTKTVATISALLSGSIIIIFSFIPVYFGMKAKLAGLYIPTGANPLVVFVEANMNQLVVVLVMCSLFAAITSTADSLLCAISSNIAQDFGALSSRFATKLGFSKFVTFITGVVALIIAYFFDNIIDVMTYSYDLLVSCILVSVLFCFFRKNLKQEAAIVSVLFGFIGFVAFKLVYVPIPVVLASLGLSLIGYLIGPWTYRQVHQK